MIQCLNCGVDIIVAKRSTRKFCSNACRQARYRKHGNSPESHRFAAAAYASLRNAQKVKAIRAAVADGLLPEGTEAELAAGKLSIERAYRQAVWARVQRGTIRPG
jgi:hypothetical protein